MAAFLRLNRPFVVEAIHLPHETCYPPYLPSVHIQLLKVQKGAMSVENRGRDKH